MATDRREQIAARLLALAAGLVGASRAFRNTTSVSAGSPAIIIWDGDENVVIDANGRYSQLVEMTPEFRLLVEEGAAGVGAALNTLRLQAIAAVLGDATLLGIIGGSATPSAGTGGIAYAGLSYALDQGRKVEGELMLHFAIRYPLLFKELS